MALKVWLSRWHDGYFAVSFLKPKKSRILGSDTESFYFREGDPVGHRYMCAAAVKEMFRDDPNCEAVNGMQPMDDPVQVELFGKVS